MGSDGQERLKSFWELRAEIVDFVEALKAFSKA